MKLLLLGDAPMALNEGGICQTLYNIFDFIPPENFLGICEVEQDVLISLQSVEPYTERYRFFKINWIKISNIYIKKAFKKTLSYINYSLSNIISYKHLKEEITAFKPDVIICCPNSPVGVVMYNKLIPLNFKGKVIPYFMDNWMSIDNTKWVGGSVKKTVKKILEYNKSWMVIGAELENILKQQYNVTASKVLYARNPVDLNLAPIESDINDNEEFTIAYAGALWPMHYDAFYSFAKGLHRLKKKRKVKLIIYTRNLFWQNYKSKLEPLDVINGGYIAYKDIHTCLNKANALLITSAFDKKHYYHSTSSLQTKITDYCLSKRLIISIGPDYSANNNFIKQNMCGVCIESNETEHISKFMDNLIENFDQYKYLIGNAYDSLKDFTKDVVQAKVKCFLIKKLHSHPTN